MKYLRNTSDPLDKFRKSVSFFVTFFIALRSACCITYVGADFVKILHLHV